MEFTDLFFNMWAGLVLQIILRSPPLKKSPPVFLAGFVFNIWHFNLTDSFPPQ